MSQLLDLDRMHVYEVGGTHVYQLLCGRDLEGNMNNFIYLVVNTHERTAIAVDAAWDVEAIYNFANLLGVKIIGSIYTHSHADHVGGHGVAGCAELAEKGGEVWAGEYDAEAIGMQCKLKPGCLQQLRDGDVVPLGELALHVLHTPGHTPGSICVLLSGPGMLTPRGLPRQDDDKEIRVPVRGGLLISGDTMFVGGYGRTDLRESNHDHMLQSLLRLTELSLDTVVLPGHNYDPLAYTTIDVEKGGSAALAGAKNKGFGFRALPLCCCESSCGPAAWKPGQRLEVLPEGGRGGEIVILEAWIEEEGGYSVRGLSGTGGAARAAILPPERLRARGRREVAQEGGTISQQYRVVHGALLRKDDPIASGACGKIIKTKRPPGSLVHCTGRTWTGAQGTTWAEVDPVHDQRGGWLALHGRCFGIDAELLRLEEEEHL